MQKSHSASTGERMVLNGRLASPDLCRRAITSITISISSLCHMISVCRGYFSPCNKQVSCEMQDTGTNSVICDSQAKVKTFSGQFEMVAILKMSKRTAGRDKLLYG